MCVRGEGDDDVCEGGGEGDDVCVRREGREMMMCVCVCEEGGGGR